MKKKSRDLFLISIGIVADAFLIAGVYLLPFGNTFQKLLFLAGNALLLYMAAGMKDRILITVSAIVLIGVLMAFVPSFPIELYMLTIIVSAIVAFAYLAMIGTFKGSALNLMGGLMTVLVAIGYATNVGSFPIITGFGLGVGSFVGGFYSLINLIMRKIRTYAIWATLSFLFAVNPLILLFSHLL